MAPILQTLVLGSSISFSFILAGNAITQSFMTVPALLVGFPNSTSPDYSSKSALLGRQWGVCWTAGNVFFRPISSLGALGYAFTTYSAYASATTKADWRLFAIAALMHVVVIIHSAVNMQPLNDKIASLDSESKGKDTLDLGAETLLRKWGKLNYVRIVSPLIAGTFALSQLFL
ncbi:uncharacterized protein LY89DRAFT_577895 [Mollisia scopiformis]|uniref:DUF1772-domain-containing protein n=1 Tax=Mollisia scopiformis TaxID=149040 RepID=A0A194XND2_MOLSC|nr:uncharacterized protein LY89DRAFT_577895 [Mollisia scopiformis]KUJ21257.1 hypothetical protein LY89DRAFT_577895 [Mollisia scopiformis]